MITKYTMGVDLGTLQDFSAIGILESVEFFEPKKALPGTREHPEEPRVLHTEQHLRHLERPEAGTTDRKSTRLNSSHYS